MTGLMRVMVKAMGLILGLLLPLTTTALTTTPAPVVYPIERAVFAYDDGVVSVISNSASTGFATIVCPQPFFGQISHFVAAKSELTVFRQQIGDRLIV